MSFLEEFKEERMFSPWRFLLQELQGFFVVEAFGTARERTAFFKEGEIFEMDVNADLLFGERVERLDLTDHFGVRTGKRRTLMDKVVCLPVEDIPEKGGVVQIVPCGVDGEMLLKGKPIEKIPLYQTTERAGRAMMRFLGQLRYGESQSIFHGDNGERKRMGLSEVFHDLS